MLDDCAPDEYQRLSYGLVDVTAIVRAYIKSCSVQHGGEAQGIETFDAYVNRVGKYPISQAIAAIRDRNAPGIGGPGYDEDFAAL